MNISPIISIVCPVYGCNASLNELCDRLHSELPKINNEYEIIFIDDGCRDGSWKIIEKLAIADSRVKGIRLSRNFGQHNAITAGLDFSKGDWVVVMDCDLQDLPEEIPKLYVVANSGYDMVIGRRVARKDGYVKKLFSKLFFLIFCYLTEINVDHRVGNFGIYSRRVVDSIKKLKEQKRSLGGFTLWVGFRRAEIEINHSRRFSGESSYSITALFNLAIDTIFSYSDKPLRLMAKCGFLISFTSFLYGIWLVIRYVFWEIPVEGWTTLAVSIYMSTGLILASLGVVALYIGRVFDEVKARPLYLIEDTTFSIG